VSEKIKRILVRYLYFYLNLFSFNANKTFVYKAKVVRQFLWMLFADTNCIKKLVTSNTLFRVTKYYQYNKNKKRTSYISSLASCELPVPI